MSRSEKLTLEEREREREGQRHKVGSSSNVTFAMWLSFMFALSLFLSIAIALHDMYSLESAHITLFWGSISHFSCIHQLTETFKFYVSFSPRKHSRGISGWEKVKQEILWFFLSRFDVATMVSRSICRKVYYSYFPYKNVFQGDSRSALYKVEE